MDVVLEVQKRFNCYFIKLVLTDESCKSINKPLGYAYTGDGTTIHSAIERAKDLMKWEFDRMKIEFPEINIVNTLDKGQKLSSQEAWLKSYREKGGEMPCETYFEW